MRRLRQLTLLAAAALLAASVLVAALAGCGSGGNSGSQAAGQKVARMPAGPLPDTQLRGVEFTEVKDGERQWDLRAARMEYDRATGLGHLTQVDVTFYLSEGEPVRVLSERGTFEAKAKEIDMIGNVRGHADPYELFSDTLHYDPKQRVLTTPGPARLESPGMSMAGTGLRYDLQTRQLSIKEDARTISDQRLF